MNTRLRKAVKQGSWKLKEPEESFLKKWLQRFRILDNHNIMPIVQPEKNNKANKKR